MKLRYAKCSTFPFGRGGIEIRWTKYPGEFNFYVWIRLMQHHWRITW